MFDRRQYLFPSVMMLMVACVTGSEESLEITPAAPAVRVGETLSLRAQPLEDLSKDLEWEILEPHGGGFLQSRGTAINYVAPQAAGTYHLLIRSARSNGSPVKHTLTVRVLPNPKLEPPQASLAPGGTQLFTARMKGLPRSTVTWTVEEPDGGTVDTNGLYHAPNRLGTYHVVATSTLDPDVSVTATVRVE